MNSQKIKRLTRKLLAKSGAIALSGIFALGGILPSSQILAQVYQANPVDGLLVNGKMAENQFSVQADGYHFDLDVKGRIPDSSSEPSASIRQVSADSKQAQDFVSSLPSGISNVKLFEPVIQTGNAEYKASDLSITPRLNEAPQSGQLLTAYQRINGEVIDIGDLVNDGISENQTIRFAELEKDGLIAIAEGAPSTSNPRFTLQTYLNYEHLKLGSQEESDYIKNLTVVNTEKSFDQYKSGDDLSSLTGYGTGGNLPQNDLRPGATGNAGLSFIGLKQDGTSTDGKALYGLATEVSPEPIFVDEQTDYHTNPQIQYMSRLYNGLGQYNTSYTLSQIWVYQPGLTGKDETDSSGWSDVKDLKKEDFLVYNVPEQEYDADGLKLVRHLPEKIRFTNNPSNSRITITANNIDQLTEAGSERDGIDNKGQKVVKADAAYNKDDGYDYAYTILIEEGTVIRLLYTTVDSSYSVDTSTFFDYDITDGVIYSGAFPSNNTQDSYPTSEQQALMGVQDRNDFLFGDPNPTDPDVIFGNAGGQDEGSHDGSHAQGINLPENYGDNALVNGTMNFSKYAFGNNNTGTGLGNVRFSNGDRLINQNNPNSGGDVYSETTFGIVNGLNYAKSENDPDILLPYPQWSNGVWAPDVFGTSEITGKTIYSRDPSIASKENDPYFGLDFKRSGSTYVLDGVSVNQRAASEKPYENIEIQTTCDQSDVVPGVVYVDASSVTSNNYVATNAMVSFSAIARTGYQIKNITVWDDQGKSINFTPAFNANSLRHNHSFNMPSADNVIIHVEYVLSAGYYPITPEGTSNGTYTLSTRAARVGESVFIDVVPDEGFQIDQVQMAEDGKDPAPVSPTEAGKYSFVMPAAPVKVSVHFKPDDDQSVFMIAADLADISNISVQQPDHGTLSIEVPSSSGSVIEQGKEVIVEASADTGYYLKNLNIKSASGDVSFSLKDLNTFSFVMPSSDVTISASMTDHLDSIDAVGNLQNQTWIANSNHGTVKASVLNGQYTSYNSSWIVTLEFTPDPGYVMSDLHINGQTYYPKQISPSGGIYQFVWTGYTGFYATYIQGSTADPNATPLASNLVLNPVTGGSIVIKDWNNPNEAIASGKKVTLIADPETGKHLSDLSGLTNTLESVHFDLSGFNEFTFTMPSMSSDGQLVINAGFDNTLSTNTPEGIHLQEVRGEGSLQYTYFNKTNQWNLNGAFITVVMTPAEGYVIGSLSVNDGQVPVYSSENTEGQKTYMFAYPGYANLKARFRKPVDISMENVTPPKTTNLSYFQEDTLSWAGGAKVYTNEFWPMDAAPSYGTDGHDLVFGSRSFNQSNLVRYNGGTAYPIGDDGKNHNAYFGMSYSVEFTITPGYIAPLEYFFYGDDDMWVFLDDPNDNDYQPRLIADIGGVHSSIGTYVNLWNWIDPIPLVQEDSISSESTDCGSHGTACAADGSCTQKAEPKTYRMTIFFTERGASGSSCYMRFNLPIDPLVAPTDNRDDVIVIQKDLVNEQGESVTTPDYDFENPSNPKNEGIETFDFYVNLFNENQKPYYDLYDLNIYETSNPDHCSPDVKPLYSTTIGTAIDEDGWYTFKLVPGTYAVISNLPDGTHYSVAEKKTNDYITRIATGSHDHSGSGTSPGTITDFSPKPIENERIPGPDGEDISGIGTEELIVSDPETQTLNNYVLFTNSKGMKSEVQPGNGIEVLPGQDIDYSITWTTIDTNDDSTVLILDPIDPNLEFKEATIPASDSLGGVVLQKGDSNFEKNNKGSAAIGYFNKEESLPVNNYPGKFDGFTLPDNWSGYLDKLENGQDNNGYVLWALKVTGKQAGQVTLKTTVAKTAEDADEIIDQSLTLVNNNPGYSNTITNPTQGSFLQIQKEISGKAPDQLSEAEKGKDYHFDLKLDSPGTGSLGEELTVPAYILDIPEKAIELPAKGTPSSEAEVTLVQSKAGSESDDFLVLSKNEVLNYSITIQNSSDYEKSYWIVNDFSGSSDIDVTEGEISRTVNVAARSTEKVTLSVSLGEGKALNNTVYLYEGSNKPTEDAGPVAVSNRTLAIKPYQELKYHLKLKGSETHPSYDLDGSIALKAYQMALLTDLPTGFVYRVTEQESVSGQTQLIHTSGTIPSHHEAPAIAHVENSVENAWMLLRKSWYGQHAPDTPYTMHLSLNYPGQPESLDAFGVIYPSGLGIPAQSKALDTQNLKVSLTESTTQNSGTLLGVEPNADLTYSASVTNRSGQPQTVSLSLTLSNLAVFKEDPSAALQERSITLESGETKTESWTLRTSTSSDVQTVRAVVKAGISTQMATSNSVLAITNGENKEVNFKKQNGILTEDIELKPLQTILVNGLPIGARAEVTESTVLGQPVNPLVVDYTSDMNGLLNETSSSIYSMDVKNAPSQESITKSELDPGAGKKVGSGDVLTYDISYTVNEEANYVLLIDPLDPSVTFEEANVGGYMLQDGVVSPAESTGVLLESTDFSGSKNGNYIWNFGKNTSIERIRDIVNAQLDLSGVHSVEVTENDLAKILSNLYANNGYVIWLITNKDDLSVNGTHTVGLKTKVKENAASMIYNDAAVIYEKKGPFGSETITNPTRNDQQEKEEAYPGDGEPVSAGQMVTYNITYQNEDKKADSILIFDALDPGVDFVSANLKGFKDKSTEPADPDDLTLYSTSDVPATNNRDFIWYLPPDMATLTQIEASLQEALSDSSFTINLEQAIEHFDPKGDLKNNGYVLWFYREPTLPIQAGLQVAVNNSAQDFIINQAAVQNGNQEALATSRPSNPLEEELLDPTPVKTELSPGDGILVSEKQEVVYSIDFANGTTDKQDILIRDPLDQGVDFAYAKFGDLELKAGNDPVHDQVLIGEDNEVGVSIIYDEVNHQVIWKLNEYPANTSGTVTLGVTVNDTAAKKGYIDNQAFVRVGNGADLATDVPYNPLPGQHKYEISPGDGQAVEEKSNITYRITYENTSDHPTDVTIVDPLDPYVEFVEASDNGTYYPKGEYSLDPDLKIYASENNNGVVVWTIENVASKQSGQVTLRTRVKEDLPERIYQIENQAALKYGEGSWNPTEIPENPINPNFVCPDDPDDDCSNGCTPPEQDPDLPQYPAKTQVRVNGTSIDSTQYTFGENQTGEVVETGDTLSYEISWSNYQAKDGDVRVMDLLSDGVNLVSASYQNVMLDISKGNSITQDGISITYNPDARLVTWSLGKQKSGASGKVSLVVMRNSQMMNSISNYATIAIDTIYLNTEGVINPTPQEPGSSNNNISSGNNSSNNSTGNSATNNPYESITTKPLNPSSQASSVQSAANANLRNYLLLGIGAIVVLGGVFWFYQRKKTEDDGNKQKK